MDFPFDDPDAVALASAARHGNAYAIRTQVQEGADPDARGRDGVNLLQFSILAGSLAGFEELLDCGADPEAEGFNGTTALHTAALADDPSYLQLMLEQGADPDARNRRNGETPLAIAVSPRTSAQFSLLLDAGADPDASDTEGYTPLHRAAMINAGAHVLALLEAGASPQARSGQETTFQAYLFRTPEDSLTPGEKREREAVVAWLREHDVPLEAGPGG